MFAQTAAGGAAPILFAATAGGSYAGPNGRRQMTGAPTVVGRSDAARDPASVRRLWTESEKPTQITHPAGQLPAA